jgi:hypothetical protein
MIGKQNYWISFVVIILFIAKNCYAQQASLEMFGQNRIQAKKYEWQYYDSTHFRVFYSSYGKFNAQFLIQQAESDLANIVYAMRARQPRKINIVLYNSYTDYKQSNIGRYNEDLITGNGGAFDVSNNSLSIYFDGTHKGMQQQVRRGIVGIIKDNLLYGYTLKEVVKNSIKMNVPAWFTNGYTNYISDEWTPEDNAKIKSLLSKRPKRKFDDFTIDYPKLIGHSFFNFISKQYDDDRVNDIIYVVRVKNNVEKAILTVLKKTPAMVFKEWKSYYYNASDSILDATDSVGIREKFAIIKPAKGAHLKNFAISPNGADIAYCEIKDGGYSIFLYNKNSKKSNKIISNEIKTNLEIFDPNYPIICWNKDGRKLAIMYEKDFMQRLKVYDTKNGRISDRILTVKKFDRLNSMCFMEDDDKLVISAIKKGQSDLYQYTIKNALMANITKDVWNDINPTFVSRKGQDGILFLSNRPINKTIAPIENNELPNQKFNIYFYNANTASSTLLKLSDGIEAAISNPIMHGDQDFAFLVTDSSNSKQRIIAAVAKDMRDRDSVYYFKTVPLPFSIQQQAFISRNNSIMEIVSKNGAYEVYNTKVKIFQTADSIANPQTFNILKNNETPKSVNKNKLTTYYLSEFVNDIDSFELENNKQSITQNQLRKFKTRKYTSTFSPDFLQTTLDNSILFNRYQNISQQGYGFQSPSIAGLLKLSLIDVMEDHKITAAVRIPTSIGSGHAYMLKYSNYKKRLDWGVTFFRNTGNYIANPGAPPPFYSPYKEFVKLTNTYGEVNITWPLNVVTSLRLTTGIRLDRSTYKISTDYSSKLPNQSSVWNFNRIEYVLDNTAQSLFNIRKGTRLKIYADGFFKHQDTNALYVTGIDVRYYLPIYKNFILASRISNAYSFGKAKILYCVGGIDNEFTIPNNNQDTLNLDATINYQYQTLASTLRGYAPNTAMGSSFGILNEELRLPIANTLLNRTFRNKFINEFQLILFADIASAWAGFSPGGTYINYFRRPAKEQQYRTYFGYGVGARTKLFGYNIHADVAWNNETLLPGEKRNPRLHLSTTQDF